MQIPWRRLVQQRPAPYVSLVLPVKNAMPHVKKAIEALRRQTYRNFEVLVQDGGSTDDTMEYLCSITDLPRIEVVSEPDSGVGQAYNRGIARSVGELICLIAADEVLDDDALEKGVHWFQRHPKAAVVYGGVRLVDKEDRITQILIPPKFDLIRFLHNELFPTTAGFLIRERVGADLYYDESLRTCPDYDFWIRLGSRFGPRELIVVPEPIVSALGDRTSLSYRVESFEAFTRDKLFVLDRYLRLNGDTSKAARLRRTASAGILTWAAECVFGLEGPSRDFLEWCREAAKFDPHSPRLLKLAKRTEAFEISPAGQFEIRPLPQPLAPTGPTRSVDGGPRLAETYARPEWKGARVLHGSSVRVLTTTPPWSYSALIPLASVNGVESNSWFWAKLNVDVHFGQVGIGVLASDDLFSERLISKHEGRMDIFVRLNQPTANGLMVRNGSLLGPSMVEIFSATTVSAPKADR